jgi:hypothetical protein
LYALLIDYFFVDGLFFSRSCQNIPVFETTIYVKDAVGNLDSVQIGFDPDDIKEDTIQFHEVIDHSPFDSIFDLRITGHTFDPDFLSTLPMYRRYITGTEDWSGCQFGGSAILLIHAKYQPVTIYWNHPDFYNMPCTGESYLLRMCFLYCLLQRFNITLTVSKLNSPL